MPSPSVAILGAGPAGLVAARYLQSEGFSPIIFEQGSRIGGQWSGDPAHSGVWPAMRTNTSRINTAFSDLPHPAGTATYPTNQQVRAYLERYAEHFGLTAHIRLNTPVRELARANSGGWTIRTGAGQENFSHAVIATGRYHKPSIPAVPGLDTFSGSAGVTHAFAYKHPEQLRGLRVLVAGCSISSLEIASDLAMLGAARVVLSNRKQRYVLPKLIAGVPTDHLAFTRWAALAGSCLPPEALAAGMKEFVLAAAGNPEQFGAPRPADNIFAAGITQSQYFLPLVAEGRIAVKPWIASVDGETVHFQDNTSEAFDAILFATGYELDLPFLSDDIRATLNADAHHLDLYNFTFHPDLPGLAFLGLIELMGPYFPALELQARWIAYTFSGAIPAPSAEALRSGIAAYQARRGGPQALPCHAANAIFAHAAGVEPPLDEFPALARALLFGPLTAMRFRMSGRDSLPDAAERFAAQVREFACMTSPELTPMQAGQLQALAANLGDPQFSRFATALLGGA